MSYELYDGRVICGLFGVILLAACSTTGSAAASAAAERPSASGHTGLPDFELTSVDGEGVRLSDYVGKSVVVLSFWATWCEPCKAELPHLNRIYAAHKAEGLVILSIAMDDPTTTAQVAPFVKRAGLTFPVLLDSNTRAASLYNVHKSAPFTVVIGRNGKIEASEAGYEPGSEIALEDQLVKLLRQPPLP